MRKVFPLTAKNHAPARVVELIKRDVRRYLKRERGKTLPAGVDFWDFACSVGPDRSKPEVVHVANIGAALDRAQELNWPEVYVEILSKPGRRAPKSGA
jgi:hypothetical protein